MSCLLNYDKNGNAVVRGEGAPLFSRIMSSTGNEEFALKIWATSISKGFKNLGLSPTQKNVEKYINMQDKLNAPPLNNTEILDGLEASLGVEGFQAKFLSIFTNEEGDFEVNLGKMTSSGFMSADEVLDVFSNPTKVKEMWTKLYSQELPSLETDYKLIVDDENGGVTTFGLNRKINPDVLNDSVVRGEIEDESILDVIEDNQEYVDDLLNSKMVVEQFVENPLTGEVEQKVYNNTFNILVHSIDENSDTTKLKEVLDFIINVPGYDFISEKNDVKELFKILDLEAGKLGIDFVGIENKFRLLPTKELMKLLLETRVLAENISNGSVEESHIEDFANTYDEVFGSKEFYQTSVEDVLTNPKQIVRIEGGDKSSLYEKYGFVNIKNNLYRKVGKSSDVVLALYNKAKKGGKNILGDRFENTISYKNKFIREANKIANSEFSKYYTLSEKDAKDLVLLEKYYKESNSDKTISKERWVRLNDKNNLSIIENTPSKIIKDIIKNKRKGVTLPLAITQRGIELTTKGEFTLKSLNDDSLIDYLTITGQLDGDLKYEENYNVNERDFNRNYFSNNPFVLEEYLGVISDENSEGGVQVKGVTEDFIRIGSDVYENMGEESFQKVERGEFEVWDRKAPTKTLNVKQNPSLNTKQNVRVNKANNKGVDNKIDNVLLSNPLLTIEEAENAFNGVYSEEWNKC